MTSMVEEVTYEFHHMGIPTEEVHADERFSARYGVYTSDSASELLRVQWHRFTENTSFPDLITKLPHPAFKVNDLDRAIAGRAVIVPPFEPITGFRVAFIEDHGLPIELIQTSLSDEEIWGRARSGENAPLYGAGHEVEE